MKKVFNCPKFHSYRSNFLQNPYFRILFEFKVIRCIYKMIKTLVSQQDETFCSGGSQCVAHHVRSDSDIVNNNTTATAKCSHACTVVQIPVEFINLCCFVKYPSFFWRKISNFKIHFVLNPRGLIHVNFFLSNIINAFILPPTENKKVLQLSSQFQPKYL